ncbi:hypothetical protein MAPG_00678 [Magnaporthiopsis poae ATCC 64411]|uniref:Uncharacterized protein n=1 Tax=Magnaporthiopsis poae (strain ATCC 64411 / 73-15) TaxID=644358 RepID=A0A0C4DLN4_MAGP6|nr:hypothetical protein MAPG_00678 [Magnaporthiopsis poae ATCC 64411]
MAASTHGEAEPGRDTTGMHRYGMFNTMSSPRARAQASPVQPLAATARPDTPTPTPIRGDFIPVSTSSLTMPSSPPRRDQSPDHGVTLHMSFTDSQMNLLAEAISRPNSPEKGPGRGRSGGADGVPAQRSHHRAYSEDDALAAVPQAATSFLSHHHAPPPVPPSGSHGYAKARGQSPARRAGPIPPRQYPVRPVPLAPQKLREDSPARCANRRARYPANLSHDGHFGGQVASSTAIDDRYGAPTIAQRRGGPRPSVDTLTAQLRGSPSHRKTPIEIMQEPVVPERSKSTTTASVSRFGEARGRADSNPSPSFYSTEDRKDGYESEYETIVAVTPPDSRDGSEGVERSGAVMQSLAEYEQLYNTHMSMQAEIVSERPAAGTGPDRGANYPRVYSPLTPFIETMEEKMPRRKVLIGERGWLENTVRTADGGVSGVGRGRSQAPPAQQQQQQKRGIFESLKKAAKDVVERADLKGATAHRLGPRPMGGPGGGGTSDRRAVSRLDISLDPREQSVFYCELEFLVTTGLEGYIAAQFNAGRLQPVKLNKVAEAWRQKGRPRVVGFRYDIETQLELVLMHLHDFKFYGIECSSPAAITGVLEMMRADGRAMRVRTFCQPDLVMAKQLLDAQKLFNIIGCPENLQYQLHQVVRFFKLVLAREKNIQDRHYRRPPPPAKRAAPLRRFQREMAERVPAQDALSRFDRHRELRDDGSHHRRHHSKDQLDEKDLYRRY